MFVSRNQHKGTGLLTKSRHGDWLQPGIVVGPLGPFGPLGPSLLAHRGTATAIALKPRLNRPFSDIESPSGPRSSLQGRFLTPLLPISGEKRGLHHASESSSETGLSPSFSRLRQPPKTRRKPLGTDPGLLRKPLGQSRVFAIPPEPMTGWKTRPPLPDRAGPHGGIEDDHAGPRGGPTTGPDRVQAWLSRWHKHLADDELT